CSCECERKETPYRREGKSWAGSEIFARSGTHPAGPAFAFTKLAVVTCPDWLSTACDPNISLLSQQD
ncbi:MAG TPA: hypothetical protein VIJ01_06075, partial [Candidatus Angelobacter sp.]